MIPPVIVGSIPSAKIISIGQAPGIHEKEKMMPFSYTAGKTLFKWFASIGISEEEYRRNVNMSAVCRCFPGKQKTGDRKPDSLEINNCSVYLKYEIQYHKPSLVIPIGKMAIDLLIPNSQKKLDDLIGSSFQTELYGHTFDWIPLPHPSGLNVWNHTEKGKKLIEKAMLLIKSYPEIQRTFDKT